MFYNTPLPQDTSFFPRRAYSSTEKQYNFYVLLLACAIALSWETDYMLKNVEPMTENQWLTM